MSKGYILARLNFRWALKGLALVAALIVLAWFSGCFVSLLLG